MANPQTVSIFTAKTTNGIGTVVKTIEHSLKVETEPVTIQVAGTWEGVTVKAQISLDEGATFTTARHVRDDGTLIDVSITADSVINVGVPSGVQFTLIISGVGGSPPSINAWVRGNIIPL